MTGKALLAIRREFHSVLEAIQRLEQLGSLGEGHATDIAYVLCPLNKMMRGLMGELDPYVELQTEHTRKAWAGSIDLKKCRSIASIRRSIELGVEALEGIQELAAKTGAEMDASAKDASRPMVTAIFQIEGAMNDLDALIDFESKRKGSGLLGPLGVIS